MEGKFGGWNDKGYGFIVPDSGLGNVFIHCSSVANYGQVPAGARLSFEIKETTKGIQATNVTVIDQGQDVIQGVGHVSEWVPGVRTSYGFVSIGDGRRAATIYVNQGNLGKIGRSYLCPGDQVNLTYIKNSIGKYSCEYVAVQVTEVVGWRPGKEPFDNFADMGEPRVWLQDLSDLAEEERWEFKEGGQFRPVLLNYMRHTFRRLQEMNDEGRQGIKTSSTGEMAILNTGLVTRRLEEDIYAAFEKNPHREHQPWRFLGFMEKHDRRVMNQFGANLPPLAEYFEDPSVLLFDRRFKIVPDYPHIFDNKDRFPDSLRDQDERYVMRTLDGAIAQSMRRAYRNNQVAVPQFFRDKGKACGSVQLLLPLSLEQAVPPKVDLAIVLERVPGQEVYRGHTVLSLEMAYKNARLLTRPESSWLNPRVINEDA